MSGNFICTAITLNQESNFTRREKNHSLFHWIPYSTETHWRLQNCKDEFGCYARAPHRWLLEYRWIKRFVWFLDRFHSVCSIGRETSRRTYAVQGETEKETADRKWERMPTFWRRGKSVHKKSQNSIMPDDIKLAGKKQNIDQMWKVLNKEVDLGEKTSFLKSNVHKAESYSEVTLWKMILDLMKYSLNKDHQHFKWQQLRLWISSPDCLGCAWSSSRRSICFFPRKNGRCSQIVENSKIGMSRHLDSSTTTQMA